MKMTDVLNMVAKGEIKDQTILEIYHPIHILYTFTFNEKSKAFYSNTEYSKELSNYFQINDKFLNLEVELIPPKEMKYLIKVDIRGLNGYFSYLNYSEITDYVSIQDKVEDEMYKTNFTKKEMQDIQSVREFLEDMNGRYELIEA